MVRYTGKDFVDVEGIAVASVLASQSSGVQRTKLDTPVSNSFAADDDASLRKQIFDIPVTEIEPVVQPDCVGNDFRWESVV
jgi:hypothetical protein